MKNNKFNCIEARQVDLVDYLFKLGYEPKKIRNNDYWYLSPLRNERTPSFKVNRKLNVWFDFGEGKGGNLVDFGVQYFKCSVREFLNRVNNDNISTFSFQPHMADEKKNDHEGKIQIISAQSLASKHLLDYLRSRKIPLSIAEHYCKEIEFSLYNKTQGAIGFKNDAGGYELRSADFKGSSSPKDITLFSRNPSTDILVFEGFFNFLSWQTIHQKNILLPKLQPNFLVLNSLPFFEKAKEIMEKHSFIQLYLDRDNSGIKATKEALLISDQYRDESYKYKNHKDMNEFLVKEYKMEIPAQRIGRRL
jgi:hypothetical protein